ncbi:hypothetical protein HDR58_06760 [bacterium]|nr:hypothetical protein [bacterium]
MQVNPITQNNNQNFNGVKFFPKVNEWEPRILEAVLDSPSIKKTIAENEAIGSDTLIYSNPTNNYYSSEYNIELGVVKLKDGWENFCFKTKKHSKESVIQSVIDLIKTKDAKLNIPEKLKTFNEFVLSLTKKTD